MHFLCVSSTLLHSHPLVLLTLLEPLRQKDQGVLLPANVNQLHFFGQLVNSFTFTSFRRITAHDLGYIIQIVSLV